MNAEQVSIRDLYKPFVTEWSQLSHRLNTTQWDKGDLLVQMCKRYGRGSSSIEAFASLPEIRESARSLRRYYSTACTYPMPVDQLKVANVGQISPVGLAKVANDWPLFEDGTMDRTDMVCLKGCGRFHRRSRNLAISFSHHETCLRKGGSEWAHHYLWRLENDPAWIDLTVDALEEAIDLDMGRDADKPVQLEFWFDNLYERRIKTPGEFATARARLIAYGEKMGWA
jgi:hypothetical protein